jgi:ABC-type dipeptide/oligopeptide/nickel transport system permease component
MWAYVARRLLQAVVVLLMVTLISFVIFQYLGDPVVTLAGRYASEAQRQEVREMLHLDEPFYVQFAIFVQNAVQGDFGMSYVSRVPALQLVAERLPASIELAFAAELIAVVFGVALGVLVAAFPRAALSRVTMTAALFGVSIPTFLIGILLILVFAVWLGWMPPFGRGEVVAITPDWRTSFLTLDGLRHIVMPALTLGMFQLALLFRLTRSGMVEALGSDYIRTAWAKGLGWRKVLFKHALRNVLIPVVTMIGLQFGQLIGFSIVTESIFQWPGAGNLLLKSVYESDFPVIAVYIMLIALIVVVLNTVVDLAYAFLNPKIRYV